MADLAITLCGERLASNAPEWVHLMPTGSIRGRDGRNPEKYEPIEAMQSLMSERFLQSSALSETRVQAKIKDAVTQGYITPGMKDRATSLCRQNEASFGAFLEKSGRVFAKLLGPSHMSRMPPSFQTSTAQAQSSDAAAICRQLGLKETALND